MRYNIDDMILVSDGEVDFSLAEKFASFVNKNAVFEDGIVYLANEKETKYKVGFVNEYSDSLEKSEEESGLFNHLLSLNLLPVPPDHEITYVSKVHEMKRGGKMTWHNDGEHSLAVSFYFSSCVGGELEVVLDSNKEMNIQKTIKIAPQKNRVVVMKCDMLHRVLPVKSGKRKSIQIFVRYISREKESKQNPQD